MPVKGGELLAQLGTPDLIAPAWGGPPAGTPLGEAAPLFPRIEVEKAAAEGTKGTKAKGEKKRQAKAKGTSSDQAATPKGAEDGRIGIDDFARVALRVGVVGEAEPIPGSDKLLKLTVDVGEAQPRTIVAGIAQSYAAADLIGRRVVVVANLKPAKLFGVRSEGMVLATGDGPDHLTLLAVPDGPPAGSRVR